MSTKAELDCLRKIKASVQEMMIAEENGETPKIEGQEDDMGMSDDAFDELVNKDKKGKVTSFDDLNVDPISADLVTESDKFDPSQVASYFSKKSNIDRKPLKTMKASSHNSYGDMKVKMGKK